MGVLSEATGHRPWSGPSFYGQWQRAAVLGRFGGEDEAVLGRAERAASQEPWRRAYAECSAGWLRWLGPPSGRARVVRVGEAVWQAEGLEVRVRLLLGLAPRTLPAARPVTDGPAVPQLCMTRMALPGRPAEPAQDASLLAQSARSVAVRAGTLRPG